MDYSLCLKESKYIDFSSPLIVEKAEELFGKVYSDAEKAKIAFEFVRDEISHSFDIKAKVITAKASDVLYYKTGICHAKANLLSALLRSQGIPAGMCFQHITLADDDSDGYCVHCFNAVLLNGRWVKIDARGNKKGVNVQFSLDNPMLAFKNRQNYDEYFWPGIYINPHDDTMKILESAACIKDVYDNIPDYVYEKPDIL